MDKKYHPTQRGEVTLKRVTVTIHRRKGVAAYSEEDPTTWGGGCELEGERERENRQYTERQE